MLTFHVGVRSPRDGGHTEDPERHLVVTWEAAGRQV